MTIQTLIGQAQESRNWLEYLGSQLQGKPPKITLRGDATQHPRDILGMFFEREAVYHGRRASICCAQYRVGDEISASTYLHMLIYSLSEDAKTKVSIGFILTQDTASEIHLRQGSMETIPSEMERILKEVTNSSDPKGVIDQIAMWYAKRESLRSPMHL